MKKKKKKKEKEKGKRNKIKQGRGKRKRREEERPRSGEWKKRACCALCFRVTTYLYFQFLELLLHYYYPRNIII